MPLCLPFLSPPSPLFCSCWASSRAPNGSIIADPRAFPAGMAAPLAYIASRGLHPGIYTAIGNTTCAHRPGSAGYEKQDAASYASWGVQWIKLDNCNYPSWDPAVLYAAWAVALDAQPYRIPVAGKAVLNYSASLAYTASRRVGWDVSASFTSLLGLAYMGEPFFWQARAGDAATGVSSFATDIELLQVGNGHLTADESAAHFFLWCAMHAPLMLSTRIDRLQPWQITLLTNPEALAINADPLAGQARRVALSLADTRPVLPLHPATLSCSAASGPHAGVVAPGQVWELQPAVAATADAPALVRIVLAPTAGQGAAGLCLQLPFCNSTAVTVDVCPPAGGTACDGGLGALWEAPSPAGGPLRSAVPHAGCASFSPPGVKMDAGCHVGWQTTVTFEPTSGQVAIVSQKPGDDFIGYPLCMDAMPLTHTEVWAAPLANGDLSVVALNPLPLTPGEAATTPVVVNFAQVADALHLPAFVDAAAVRDVGARTDLGAAMGSITLDVPRHGARFVRVTPKVGGV